MKAVLSVLLFSVIACGTDPASAPESHVVRPASPPLPPPPPAVDAPPSSEIPESAHVPYPPFPQPQLRALMDGAHQTIGREELWARADHSYDVVFSSVGGPCDFRARIGRPAPPLALEPDEVALALNLVPGAKGRAEVRWTYFDGALATDKVSAKLTGDLADPAKMPALTVDLVRTGLAQGGHPARTLELHGTIALTICPGEPRAGDARLPPAGERPGR
jgi:hypothetical protein